MKEKWKPKAKSSHDKTATESEKGKIQCGRPVIKGWGTREFPQPILIILD